MATTSDGHLVHLDQIASEDAAGLKKAHQSYGASWKKRGGVGAYMVMIRKFDRMEICAEKHGWDIFKAVEDDPRAEGILDDIRDARRYLMLIESVLREKGIVKAGSHRDNAAEDGVPRSYSDLDDPRGVVAAAKALNKELNIEHEPDGGCNCAGCLGRHRLAQKPHVASCECLDCMSAEHAHLEACRREQHLKVCHGCSDPAHVHSVACCCCEKCVAGRNERAKARGCNPQCGCNDCLADGYLEQRHGE